MPAETHTPTALGGTNNSPPEPELNRAAQDLAMPRTPRHPRKTCPGPRPVTAPLRPSGGRGRGPVATAPGRVRWEPRTREIPAREFLFVDPGVSDIETILGHLRPEVEAILLDPVPPGQCTQHCAPIIARNRLRAGGEKTSPLRRRA